ncbi:MAG: hypothetical protein J0I43_09870 [Microbacterium sp.]|uniref:hypothetical protein n=1 Tax=Microbacterium sp. TaxID=51671 RepID=UPI001AC05D2D|nr:hypothetical protein [Microbacterium sp.]MBN9177659.1 hypothetical protein [Microbacterium sp.]
MSDMIRGYADFFWDALVLEIKGEMGRRDLSSRGLGRRIGKSSQYMSDRLDGGSSKTGRRVVLSVWDLAAMSQAMSVSAAELAARAHEVAIRDLSARSGATDVGAPAHHGEDLPTAARRGGGQGLRP